MPQRRLGERVRRGMVLAGVLVVGALSACSNGVEAGTLDTTAWTGARTELGDLRIHNVVLVRDDETGVLSVSMTMINTGDTEDALTELVITAGAEVAAELQPGSIALAPGTSTLVPGETEPAIQAEADLVAGQFAPVRFSFEHAGDVSMNVLVVTPENPHAVHATP